MGQEGLSDFSDQYQGQEFTERDTGSAFSGGFGELGELPEDLRGMGPVSMPDGSFMPAPEGDIYSTSYSTGFATGAGIVDPFRGTITPVPGSYSNQFNFRLNVEFRKNNHAYGYATDSVNMVNNDIVISSPSGFTK